MENIEEVYRHLKSIMISFLVIVLLLSGPSTARADFFDIVEGWYETGVDIYENNPGIGDALKTIYYLYVSENSYSGKTIRSSMEVMSTIWIQGPETFLSTKLNPNQTIPVMSEAQYDAAYNEIVSTINFNNTVWGTSDLQMTLNYSIGTHIMAVSWAPVYYNNYLSGQQATNEADYLLQRRVNGGSWEPVISYQGQALQLGSYGNMWPLHFFDSYHRMTPGDNITYKVTASWLRYSPPYLPGAKVSEASFTVPDHQLYVYDLDLDQVLVTGQKLYHNDLDHGQWLVPTLNILLN